MSIHSKKINIGFVGTGIMGLPMAKNLAKKGHMVYVYARNKNKLKNKLIKNITLCNTLEEVCMVCDVLISVLPDTKDVKSVLLSKKGVINFNKKPRYIVDMSTICPTETINISKLMKKNGVSMIDAPVSGGEIGAIEGNLSIMVGGDRKVFYKLKKILEILGQKITYVGKNGSGQVAKICNQIVVAQSINAIGEAYIIAKSFNVDIKKVREALLGGFAYSKILEVHGQRMIDNSYKPGFKTSLHYKDLRISRNIIKKNSLNLPGSKLVYKYMKETSKDKHRNKDSSAYYLTLKKNNK